MAVGPSRSVRLGFTVFGLFWGIWAVAAADVERALHVRHGAFGLIYGSALAVAAVANAIGGPLAERRHPGTILTVALAAWATAIAAGATLRQPVALALTLVVIVAAGGLVDVNLNVIASASFTGDPGGFVRFHGRFNAGGVLGAALGAVALGQGVSWRWTWLLVAVMAFALAADPSAGREPSASTVDEVGSSPTRLHGAIGLLRRERLVPIALAFVLGTMVEGGVELWGVLYLRTQLASGLLVGGGSAVLAFAVATAARILVGPHAGSRGAVRGVALGSGTAAVGLLVMAATRTAVVSGVGLVLAAGGVSMLWPLLLSHAIEGRDRPAAIVGSITAMGYLGMVIGPALIGLIGQAVGLRWGLALLGAVSAVVAVLPAWSARRGSEVR